METIITPSGNKAELLQGYALACDALNRAIEALQDAAPTGRNYRTFDALRAARVQHQARIEKLESVKWDIIAIVDALTDE